MERVNTFGTDGGWTRPRSGPRWRVSTAGPGRSLVCEPPSAIKANEPAVECFFLMVRVRFGDRSRLPTQSGGPL